MLLETRRDQWLACLTSKELSFAGDLAYWNYGLNELVTSSGASRTSSRVQLKQLELNHRWSHGMSQLSVFFFVVTGQQSSGMSSEGMHDILKEACYHFPNHLAR